jgi:hypothetical protein
VFPAVFAHGNRFYVEISPELFAIFIVGLSHDDFDLRHQLVMNQLLLPQNLLDANQNSGGSKKKHCASLFVTIWPTVCHTGLC